MAASCCISTRLHRGAPGTEFLSCNYRNLAEGLALHSNMNTIACDALSRPATRSEQSAHGDNRGFRCSATANLLQRLGEPQPIFGNL